MALDNYAFLPTAFRKVQKIWKELKSNRTSYKGGILSRNRFTRLAKDWYDRAYVSVSLFTFYTGEQSFTRWCSFSFFRHYQILFAIIIITLFKTTFLQECEWRIGYQQYLSHGELSGMTRKSDRSIVFRRKKTDQVRARAT